MRAEFLRRSNREIPRQRPTESHVGHEHFTKLVLGGWGHGAARCSEYDDPSVHMFTFAVMGPRRNFTALLLHETGHAWYALLEGADPGLTEKLCTCHRKLRRYAPRSFFDDDRTIMPFAVDYLLGPASRIEETVTNIQEFAAEAYLLYVVHGRGLLKAFEKMPEHLAGPWREIYDICRERFEGVEYE